MPRSAAPQPPKIRWEVDQRDLHNAEKPRNKDVSASGVTLQRERKAIYGGADIEAQLTDHTMVRRRSALRHKLGMHEIVQLLIQAEKNALFSCSWSRNHCLQLQENQEKTSGFNRNYLEHLGGSRTWQETQNEHALDAKYLWNSPKVAFFN